MFCYVLNLWISTTELVNEYTKYNQNLLASIRTYKFQMFSFTHYMKNYSCSKYSLIQSIFWLDGTKCTFE